MRGIPQSAPKLEAEGENQQLLYTTAASDSERVRHQPLLLLDVYL